MITENTEKVQVLMKNNTITRAKYNITTVENRVFQLVMYKLQKTGKGTLSCFVSLEEFRSIIKNKNKVKPEAISDMLTTLRKQSIYFKKTKQEQDQDSKNKKPYSCWGEWGIINGHEYDEETQLFEIEASEKVHSLLHDYLEGGYTPINLSVFFSLTNSYAQRFYELLRLWTGLKHIVNYRLDDLKEYLDIEGKYDRYVDFKRRVLTPALKELNATGMFKIESKEHRENRKVTSVDFIVTDLDKRNYFKNKETNKETIIEAESEVVVDIVEESPEEVFTGSNNNKETIIATKLPEENFLVKPLHRLVKIHFKDIDFREGAYYMAFVESEVATQIQDNVEYITMKEYGYFKQTLSNKIETINENKNSDKKANDIEEKLKEYEY